MNTCFLLPAGRTLSQFRQEVKQLRIPINRKSMKQYCLWVCLGLFWLTGCARLPIEGTVELPLTFQPGYGPFSGAMHGIYLFPGDRRNRNANPESEPEFTGVPDSWSDVSVALIETDMFQFLYQNYRSGKTTPERYEQLLKAWNWEPDTTALSSFPIRCFIGIASGIDPQGVWKVIVDRNGNRDFSDDVPFELPRVSGPDTRWFDSLALQSFPVRIELCSGGRVVEQEVPLLVVFEERYKIVLYGFPHYATCKLDGHQLGVFSTHMPSALSPFTNPSFRSFCVAEIPDTLSAGNKLPAGVPVKRNDYLILDDVLYIPQEVDLARGILRLQRTALTREEVHSLQNGFQAPSFQSQEFTTRKKITLEDYRGKYLFMEFWSDKCAPCLGTMPAWNALYDKIDTARFAMLGIVYCKDPGELTRLIGQKEISWPQIRTDSVNRINETYQVLSFPSSYLLGPDGTILGRDLTPVQMEARMHEYLSD